MSTKLSIECSQCSCAKLSRETELLRVLMAAVNGVARDNAGRPRCIHASHSTQKFLELCNLQLENAPQEASVRCTAVLQRAVLTALIAVKRGAMG